MSVLVRTLRRGARSRPGRTLALLLAAVVTAALVPATAAHADVTPYTDYYIQNVATGKCLDPPNTDAPTVAQQVKQHSCMWPPGANNQQWYLLPTRTFNGTQLYWIVNTRGGLCLDPPDQGRNQSGTLLNVNYCELPSNSDNQEWYLWPTGNPTVGDQKKYALVNYGTDLCLDVTGLPWDGSDQGEDQPLTITYCYISAQGTYAWDDREWLFRQRNPG